MRLILVWKESYSSKIQAINPQTPRKKRTPLKVYLNGEEKNTPRVLNAKDEIQIGV